MTPPNGPPPFDPPPPFGSSPPGPWPGPSGPQWTVPPAPRAANQRPIRGRRVFAGIALATLGHLVTIGIGAVAVYATRNSNVATGVVIGLVAQFALFVVCLAVGVVQLSRRDRGIGLGLLIGWAIGIIVLPVVGFGICLAALNTTTLGG